MDGLVDIECECIVGIADRYRETLPLLQRSGPGVVPPILLCGGSDALNLVGIPLDYEVVDHDIVEPAGSEFVDGLPLVVPADLVHVVLHEPEIEAGHFAFVIRPIQVYARIAPFGRIERNRIYRAA